MDENLSTYSVCPHCGKYLHRSTVWRHQRQAQQAKAFTTDLGQPDNLPLDSPAPSPKPPSLTLSEQALSELQFSDIDPVQSPPNLQDHHQPIPPSPEHLQLEDDIEMEADGWSAEGEQVISPDPNISVNFALVQPPPSDEILIEEPDIDILNASAPPPAIPTAEEIFTRARFGLSEPDDDDNGAPIPGWMEEMLRHTLDDDGDDDDDFLLDPTVDLDLEIELNAARARTAQGLPEGSPEWKAIKTFKLQMEVNLGHNAYHKLCAVYPELDLPSLKVLRRDVEQLASIVVVPYHCCPNSCICYVGAYADRQTCHHCKSSRFKPNGAPAKVFYYFPIAPHIKA
ncbi:hypothetical protein FRB90_003835, partial [Tulasnella sp. 427]